jgi:hypothetical protein
MDVVTGDWELACMRMQDEFEVLPDKRVTVEFGG